MNQLTITTMTTTMHDITDNYTTLPLFSLNVNGMSEEKKRKKLFEILRHNPNSRNTLYKKFDK